MNSWVGRNNVAGFAQRLCLRRFLLLQIIGQIGSAQGAHSLLPRAGTRLFNPDVHISRTCRQYYACELKYEFQPNA